MRGIGVIYPDEYAVEETFQLLKIPWAWYDSSEVYGVVIAKREDVKGKAVNLIDLSEDDAFKKVSNLLNLGIEHSKEPLCEMYLNNIIVGG